MKKCRESTDEKMYNFVKDRDGKTHKFIIPNHLINPPDKTAVCNTALIDSAFKFNSANRNKLMTFLKDKRLGDNSSRELFINDVESWLGLFNEETSRDIQEIRAQTKNIKKDTEKLIATLDGKYRETDEYIIEGMIGNSLKYKEPLNILNAESDYTQIHDSLKLLYESCDWILEATKPKIGQRGVRKDREFICQVAQSYSMRFLKKPVPSRKGVFKQVLNEIHVLSGTYIRSSPTIIKSVLI